MAEGHATAVLSAFKEFPLLLYILVVGKLRIAFCPTVTVLDIYGQQVGKQQCVDSLALILRRNGHQQKIDLVVVSEHGFQKVYPSGGEQTSLALLQSL